MLTREDFKNQAVRDRWDPWDSLDYVETDGGHIHRNGEGLGRSQPAKTLERLISSGELDNLRRATPASTDIVYFIQREDGGAVKVGHTTMKSVGRRLMDLQVANSEPLEIKGLFDGGVWLEAALHHLFAPTRLLGEWFEVSETMLKICPEVVA